MISINEGLQWIAIFLLFLFCWGLTSLIKEKFLEVSKKIEECLKEIKK